MPVPDQTVFIGDTVTLNGSGASDADGDSLTFNWSFTSRPSGSTAALSDTTAVNPTFVVDRAGSYTIRLVVNDGKVDSAADIVIISTQNSRPVAKVGSDQTTSVTNTVTLDGSLSSDFDGNPLTYQWSFISRPSGSKASLQNPISVNPSFVADKSGEYVVQLIANDGFVSSAADKVTISTQNSRPVANAGANQTVLVGETIILDGSGSTDVDGNLLTYSWSLTSKPNGSTATLQNPTSVNPSFVADKSGDYVIQLIVKDGTAYSAPSTVTISTLNSPPVANAGPDQVVFVNDLVPLNGSGSTDVDGDPLGFAWSINSKPANSQATLSNPLIVNPNFTVDVAGSYIIQLLVTDGSVPSTADTVTISTQNRPPVANAGPGQSVALSATVQLNGSASSDPDGNPLTYRWSILSKPNGSSAVLSNANIVNPTFTADRPGDYVAQLIVNDGSTNSAPDTVAISTENSTPMAKAGADQSVPSNSIVQLDGSVSSDPDGSPLFYAWSLTTVPGGSSATLSNPAIVNPTFTADKRGTYIGQLMVGDGSLISAPDTVQIDAVNRAPIAQDDTVNATRDTPAIVNVLGNDSDPDGDPLTVSAVTTQPTNGKAVVNPNNTITYTPAAGFTGADSFAYSISDGHSGSATATVRVTVALPNLDPVTVNDVTATTPGAALYLNVLGNDSDPNGDPLTVISYSQGANGLVVCLSNGACTYTPNAGFTGTDTFTYTVSDGKGGQKTATVTVDVGAIDTTVNAPKLDLSVVTTIYKSTEFLYTGANPIQTGVAPGTIQVNRAAVLRGKVITRDGNVLPAVTVTIVNHPEFGQTVTRSNGFFDMAVNGGGVLTIDYSAVGYLPAQRQIHVPWQDYVPVPDVALIQVDSKATTITANAGVMQFHQSNLMTDSDGSRKATLLFPAGTTATMVMPNGTTQPLTTLTVRATEFTVGPNGPKAMPAPLPPTSAYTYAVELSADEAIAAGANELRFNQPVIKYVENFLNFPVGGIVPVGYYDRAKACCWIPSDNGRVIKIVGVTAGLADVDTVGSGVLAPLTLTDAERQQLALLYSAGQSLWRVPISHFSAWDSNQNAGPPPGAGPPELPTGPPPNEPENKCPEGDPCCRSPGSIISCLSQTLGEAVPVTGTPFQLHYGSDRVPGRRNSYRLTIPLSGDSVPASLKRIELMVHAGGRSFQQVFAPAANQQTLFVWDGVDIYGRSLMGGQLATINIGYVYDAFYREPYAELNSAFGYNGNGIPITVDPAREEITISQSYTTSIGSIDSRAVGLGGWTMSVHHAYDSGGRTLYFGDGTRLDSVARGAGIISTIGGTGTAGFSGDGGPATQAKLWNPYNIALAPDGTMYIADYENNRIRRIGPDGIINTVAGNGTRGFSGDGGPATQASLNEAIGIAIAPDGSLYIADSSNHRIRRVGLDGIITTVAGTGTAGFTGDGGPATQARLRGPIGIAFGPDCSLYIADRNNHRIRRVGPDGIIFTVAGTGTAGFSGDGGPAKQAGLNSPNGVAVAQDGSLYIADRANRRIRRVGPDGIITTVAGTGTAGFSGDGGAATLASLGLVRGVTVAPDGSLYIADLDNHRIRRVSGDGIINTVAGNGTQGFSNENGWATQAALNQPYGTAVAPDGSLYIADTINDRVRRLAPANPGLSIDNFTIASQDGAELYVFTSAGRHVRTLNTLTGNARYEFAYDNAGRLSQIVEKTGGTDNVTTIEHDSASNPTKIIAPFGQQTLLTVDANGFLASITNPANESTQMSYSSAGLLQTFTNPRGKSSQYSYDAGGLLVQASDPAGGFQTFTHTDIATGYTVSKTTALGRTTQYKVERLSNGDRKLTNTFPGGASSELLIRPDGTEILTQRDGTVVTSMSGPDPRWGMQSPVTTSSTITTPNNLSRQTTTSLTATLQTPTDPLSLISQTRSVTVGGRTTTTTYTATTRTSVISTPSGRTQSIVLDTLGRPVSYQNAGLSAATMAYDSHGRLANITVGSGPTARITSYAYNAQGYLHTATDPLGRTTQYNYDAAGRVTSKTLPDGRIVDFSYDPAGNIISLTPPGQPAHTFDYSNRNELTVYNPPTVPGGGPTAFAFDADRELSTVATPEGRAVTIGYDNAGRPVTRSLSTSGVVTGVDTNVYDSAGRVAGISAASGVAHGFSYDGSLNTGENWTGALAGSVTRSYDNILRLASEAINGANQIVIVYDNDDLPTGVGAMAITRDAQNGLPTGSTVNVVTTTISYNEFGEELSLVAVRTGLLYPASS